MAAPAIPAETFLDLAIRHVNVGQIARARVLCEQANAAYPAHAGVRQLLAVVCLQEDDPLQACHHAEASLALRPDHLPTLLVAGSAQRRCGQLSSALQSFERVVALAPGHAEAWFELALVRQDLRDLDGAALALRRVLQITPERAEAEVNLGIVLQDSGHIDDAMRAYGRAFRRREDCFGRIAHALAAAPVGRLWLDLDALRATLLAMPS